MEEGASVCIRVIPLPYLACLRTGDLRAWRSETPPQTRRHDTRQTEDTARFQVRTIEIGHTQPLLDGAKEAGLGEHTHALDGLSWDA